VSGTCTKYDNTATFTTDDTQTTGSASKTVTVCVGADLQVRKTASPSFKRTYNWSISKSASPTLIRTSGSSATFNYSVTASETGFTDSDWQVAGTITVTNPNDFEEIALTNLSDAIDNGGSCSITGDTTTPLAKSEARTLNYVCTYASKPAYGTTFTNTATASWDGTAANTPHSSASGTASDQFSTPTTRANQTITVTDSYKGTLGTVTATDTTPFATKTFTYSRTVAVNPNGCTTFPNTATITQTGQTASQSVKACPTVTGLTIGFWQNKNGQALITGGASTSGVCNSGTYLRQYAPFQDLSATATCAQVATYVYNVIKAANASGASMNAMLKAQMLATALNVFFNKTNGNEKIDLTQVCKMIDNTSTGTGTCSGTYSNASSAFGGATSLTVNQLLAYAASQSNIGGSSWYGNVKATQELAKNTFDAINNGAALSA
jgi:hypothetical protein